MRVFFEKQGVRLLNRRSANSNKIETEKPEPAQLCELLSTSQGTASRCRKPVIEKKCLNCPTAREPRFKYEKTNA